MKAFLSNVFNTLFLFVTFVHSAPSNPVSSVRNNATTTSQTNNYCSRVNLANFQCPPNVNPNDTLCMAICYLSNKLSNELQTNVMDTLSHTAQEVCPIPGSVLVGEEVLNALFAKLSKVESCKLACEKEHDKCGLLAQLSVYNRNATLANKHIEKKPKLSVDEGPKPPGSVSKPLPSGSENTNNENKLETVQKQVEQPPASALKPLPENSNSQLSVSDALKTKSANETTSSLALPQSIAQPQPNEESNKMMPLKETELATPSQGESIVDILPETVEGNAPNPALKVPHADEMKNRGQEVGDEDDDDDEEDHQEDPGMPPIAKQDNSLLEDLGNMNDQINPKPMTVIQGGHSAQFVKAEDSHFFFYFLTFTCLTIIGYIAFHNKNKILALALEGRRGSRSNRRRPNSASYRKLDTSLEEAMMSHPSSAPTTHVIY